MTALTIAAALMAGPVTQPVVHDVDIDNLETHAALVWRYDWGESSASVARLQEVLGVVVDGVYGPRTYDVHGLWLAYHDLDDTRPPVVVTSVQPHRETQTEPVTSPPTPALPASGWGDLITAYFPPEWWDWAHRVMMCESGGNPNNVNPASGASGLFQHMPQYWDARAASAGWSGASVFDPEANVAVSAWLLATSGPGHWGCK